MTPRLLLAAPRSGGGKTTVCCAFLQALVNRGLHPMAFKSGPDYIDPMFHSQIIGAKSGNLDLFFCEKETVRYLLECNSKGCDISVLEGAMGYYDGIALSSDASAWALAMATDTPTVLVVDARGSGVSICAEIMGFMSYRRESGIRGVILNCVSPMLYPRLKAAIEEQCGLNVYGYLPQLSECSIESRHLGLVTPGDIAKLQEKMQILAHQAENSLDIDELLTLARSAPNLNSQRPRLPEKAAETVRVAVARDEAFCFYYEDNLRLLEKLGGEIVFFSPIHDKKLPDCDALYLGGGYPELYARQLSENASMRESIRRAICEGFPTIAECGGFLYLHEQLEDKSGVFYPMAGIVSANAFRTNRLGRFGYVMLESKTENLLAEIGEQLPAHEFHYWESEEPGCDFCARKPQSTRGWECVHSSATLYAGFPHLHFYGKHHAAKRLLDAALRKKRETK